MSASRTKRMKSKVATVHVALTDYGRAAYRFQQATKRADMCEHPTQEAAASHNGHDRCGAYAKFTLEGMNVCGKHASYILLQAAYRAGIAK